MDNIDDIVKRKGRGRPAKYNWDKKLVVGTTFELFHGFDYDCSQESMYQQIRAAASKRKLRVRIVDRTTSLLVFVEVRTKDLVAADRLANRVKD